MNKNKINVGRVKSRMVDKPWWMHCPLCPIHTGFNFHPSQERAWALELVRRGKNS
jgi:hypothetical protein